MPATNRAPDVNEIAREIAAAHPEWNREKVYNEAHKKCMPLVRAYMGNALARMVTDPAVDATLRRQRADAEARRALPPEPNIATLQSRERARLMREGLTLEEATVQSLETVREVSRQWERAHLDEVRIILQRDAGRPVQLAIRTVVAKPHVATRETFIPLGMTRGEAVDAAERGQLPTRTIRTAAAAHHMRLMDRVRTIQAKGGTFADYHTAYLAASKEIDAEDEATENEAPETIGDVAGRIEERAKLYRQLHAHYANHPERNTNPVVRSMARLYKDCGTEAGAIAMARAQVARDDAAPKAGAK